MGHSMGSFVGRDRGEVPRRPPAPSSSRIPGLVRPATRPAANAKPAQPGAAPSQHPCSQQHERRRELDRRLHEELAEVGPAPNASSGRHRNGGIIRPRPSVNTGSRPPISEVLAKITAPTLDPESRCARGSQETERRGRRQAAQGGKEIVHVEGAGHNVRREGKEETIAGLGVFLSRQSTVVSRH